MPTALHSRLAALSLGALAACSDSAPVAPDTASDASLQITSITTPSSGPWARIVEGRTGPNALYTIFTPRSWNGDAIVYVHGFRDVATPVDLRDQDGLFAVRDQFGELGYAVAYSSFDANGFVVKNGAQRTHQLSGLLAAELGGKPEHTFLAAHSLGGGIGLSLVEQFPEQYDGALLMCGIVGGSLVETQYLGHVRALFDFFFPGALPGDVVNIPPGTVVTLPQVIAAVQGNPVGLFAIASTEQTPLAFVPSGEVTDPSSVAFQTLVGSLFGALAFHARGLENVLELTHGHLPFENSGTQYSLGTPVLPAQVVAPLIAAANAGVDRFSFDRSAENYVQHHFTPTGELSIPVLTVHNTWDPAVPAFHEAALLQAVQAAGATDMLLQRFVPSFGHCAIPAEVVLQSFADLVAWVSTGNKPAS